MDKVYQRHLEMSKDMCLRAMQHKWYEVVCNQNFSLLYLCSENVLSAYNISFQSMVTQERSSMIMYVVHDKIQWHNV